MPRRHSVFMITSFCVLQLVAPATQASDEDLPLPEVPPQAAAVRYTVHTFSSRFNASDVDITGSSKTGFKWYPWKFFGSAAKLSGIAINTDGSVTLSGDTTGPNGQLATVSLAKMSTGFVGTAFGGGGYFEATLKFDPQDVLTNGFRGWPSWWSLAIEHIAHLDTEQWSQQEVGYEHFIEVDFFEYDLSAQVTNKDWNYYGGAMHDWYGVYSNGFKHESLPYFIVKRKVPTDIDFTQYHQYGFLWVPATASTKGYAQYYFDGRRLGQTTVWSQYTNQLPPPRSPWRFGIIDTNHLVLILGTGVKMPMTIKSVDVWQATDQFNIKQ